MNKSIGPSGPKKKEAASGKKAAPEIERLSKNYYPLLTSLRQKLTIAEQSLYERYEATRAREDADLWLIAQNQLRVTTKELDRLAVPTEEAAE